jgi:regulator of sigma E protease
MTDAAPSFLMTALSFIAVIAPLVFVHELGHYMVGRWFGVKAEAFSIGFGREVLGWTDRRGTRWKIGWLPLGGYVKFAGDMNPASTPSDEWLALPPEERAQTFQAKTLWQRALIVAAGPAVNFLVAILIFSAFFWAFGVPRTPARIGGFEAGSPAAAAGLAKGDLIKSIGGREIEDYDDLKRFVVLRPNARVDVLAERGRRDVLVPVTIGEMVMVDRFGGRASFGKLGVMSDRPVSEPVSAHRIPARRSVHTAAMVELLVDSLGQIVTGARPLKEMGGPLKIAQYSGEQVASGWLPFAEFVALISINLGFINLLPIPMLDGGHLTFYAIAALRRRPISPRVIDWSFRGGLALLLG